MSASRTGHGHGHGHGHRPTGVLERLWRAVTHLFLPHSHDSADRVDTAMQSSREGMRALWISLALLGVTALVQAGVVVLSGSVALLSDTLHNIADALTAVPVGVAFLLGRRPATRRYTYGYGRAEDVAGVAVVLIIAGSAIAAAVESIQRLTNPAGLTHLVAVALAAVVGFAGNEIAAQVRIRTGRKIGSAALVADGLHARTDAITSLAVLLSAGGAALGWPRADPLVGLLITVAIAMVTYTTAKQIIARLMDAVDPMLVEQARTALAGVPEVDTVDSVRLRWIGHALHAEVDLTVSDQLTQAQAHDVAHNAEHQVSHGVARLTSATVHTHLAGAHASAVFDGH
ncbi:MAG TPA: cation diffusion facilitator family transporter [Pseudonocardiaceae bacterium]